MFDNYAYDFLIGIVPSAAYLSCLQVRHQGMPLRGKGLADLPATVRVVTDSSCVGADVLGFWTALGFQRRYSMIKQGFCIDCHLDGQDVHVTGAAVICDPLWHAHLPDMDSVCTTRCTNLCNVSSQHASQ